MAGVVETGAARTTIFQQILMVGFVSLVPPYGESFD